MRHYAPDTADLLAAVVEFLDRIEPGLDAGDRYHAIVCRHLLAMVGRELSGSPLEDWDEAALADAIRQGVHDPDEGATLALLLDRTIKRVRIAKPDHLEPRHR